MDNKVATSAGLLKNASSGGDLAPFNGPVHVNKDKLVSVRQAALEINAAIKFTGVSITVNAVMHSALVLDQVSCVPITVTQEGCVKTEKNLISNCT